MDRQVSPYRTNLLVKKKKTRADIADAKERVDANEK